MLLASLGGLSVLEEQGRPWLEMLLGRSAHTSLPQVPQVLQVPQVNVRHHWPSWLRLTVARERNSLFHCHPLVCGFLRAQPLEVSTLSWE